jgi:prepilin-type N-terminal cleavage/methylation domain-containing protein
MEWMTTRFRRQQGFTIIEVLIVLAIAALILLVVFLAVPAMQRSARNEQRRRDVGAVLTFIREQALLGGNRLPHSCNSSQHWCFLRDQNLSYYDNQSDEHNNISFWNRTSDGQFDSSTDEQLEPNSPRSTERVLVRTWARCDGNQLTGEGATRHDIAAQFAIETFSGSGVLCVEI